MVAQRIRELRKSLGLSMAEFGKRLGCSRDVIGNIEYGRVEPKEVLLDHLCEVYGVAPAWLYQGDGAMFQEGDDEAAGQLRQATDIFRSLSPPLRAWALSQLQSIQQLMQQAEAQRQQEPSREAETIELLGALMQADSMSDHNDAALENSLPAYLRQLVQAQGLSMEQIAEQAALMPDELSGLMDGTQKPKRDTLLALAVALGLELAEAQRMLAKAQLPALYVKNRRDSVFIFALMKHLPLDEVKKLLEELDETAL